MLVVFYLNRSTPSPGRHHHHQQECQEESNNNNNNNEGCEEKGYRCV